MSAAEVARLPVGLVTPEINKAKHITAQLV